jgi:hypothetical protein
MGFPVHTYNRGLQLAGKPAGTILIQLLGPIDDRNYFGAAAPVVHVQVFGTGSVRVEENDEFQIRGDNSLSIGSVPVINKMRKSPRGTAFEGSGAWAFIGAAIPATAAPVTRILTPLPTFNYIQLVVAVAGTGSVAFVTDWN